MLVFNKLVAKISKNTKKGKKELLFSFIFSRIYYFCMQNLL